MPKKADTIGMTKNCWVCGKVTYIRIHRTGEIGRVCEECQKRAIKDAMDASIIAGERKLKIIQESY